MFGGLYIWITDFKRFTLDLEKVEKKTGGPKPNLFDYMNVKKHYPLDDNNPWTAFQRNYDESLKHLSHEILDGI